MSQYAFPALHGLLIWWLSTGLILFLDGLPRSTFRWSMAAATATMIGAVYELAIGATDTTVTGAYAAFTCGVLIWGWLEISFYLGYVTGPRTHRCEHGCSGWRHFGHAIQACLYHEIAVLVLAAAVMALTWGQPNQFGTWTFIVLWWMHQSARLNVFLGVPNLNAEFLPDHLDHIKSFLTNKPMNLLFPFSVTASTICAVKLFQQAGVDGPDTFGSAGYSLLGTMMVLAILEHWFLVMPLPALKVWNRLWNWSLGSRLRRARPQLAAQAPLPREVTIGGSP
jgi:putative photosynthetic complex assembly protein 2